jgi:protein-S-isoprenylcysteine O-methyltransferase Ste14
VTFYAPWARFLGLAILLAATALEFKIRIEERFMTAEFPEEYPRYRRRVCRSWYLPSAWSPATRTWPTKTAPGHPGIA